MINLRKRGLSDVVTTVLLIGITIAVVGIVWAVVNTLVTDKIENSESCFGIFGKAEINDRYTCYNSSSNKLQFSISLGDLDVDEMLIGVSSVESSTSFRISKVATTVNNVAPYPSGVGNVKLPGKNAGLTYLLDLDSAGFTDIPNSIEMIPIIDGNQCEKIDTFTQIDDCDSFSG